jgi:hypothetical protein
MKGIHKVASIVSNRKMAPHIMARGDNASWIPEMTDAQTNNGSDPKYITRTMNNINAATGNDTVVDVGFFFNVAYRR